MITTVPLAGQYGLNKDTPAQELPLNAWTTAQNVAFRDGSVERISGYASAFAAPAVTPYYLQAFQTSTAKFWVHCGLTKVYVDDGVTRTDITAASAPTGAIDDRWSGGSLNGILLLNNGANLPVYWAGNVATPCQTLTGWNVNWTAACIRPLRNYAVALDITKSGTRYRNMVKWSHAADPGAIPSSWDETDATKDAGEQDLSGSDPVIDLLPLGDVGIIYKERSMWSMKFIGQPFIWQFQRLPGDVGILNRGCVADTPAGHVVLTQGDVVIHQGQGTQSIINAKLRKWLFANIDATNYKRAFVATNPGKNEVWVCFPESSQAACTKALVWNWIDQTWGIRSLPNVTYGSVGVAAYGSISTWSGTATTWAATSGTWDASDVGQSQATLLVTETTPLISAINTATSFNGTAITSIAERTGMVLSDARGNPDPHSVKTVMSIRPRIDGTAGQTLTIEIGSQMDIEGPVTWSTGVTYTIGTSYKADAFAVGRFIAVRFTSVGGDPWRVRSFDIEYETSGMY